MSEHVVVARVDECHLSMQCQRCGSSILFDFSKVQPATTADGADGHLPNKLLADRTPHECPACGEGTGFDPKLPDGPIESYREFLRLASASGMLFQFVVPLAPRSQM
jgi:hypothetical protein